VFYLYYSDNALSSRRFFFKHNMILNFWFNFLLCLKGKPSQWLKHSILLEITYIYIWLFCCLLLLYYEILSFSITGTLILFILLGSKSLRMGFIKQTGIKLQYWLGDSDWPEINIGLINDKKTLPWFYF